MKKPFLAKQPFLSFFWQKIHFWQKNHFRPKSHIWSKRYFWPKSLIWPKCHYRGCFHTTYQHSSFEWESLHIDVFEIILSSSRWIIYFLNSGVPTTCILIWSNMITQMAIRLSPDKFLQNTSLWNVLHNLVFQKIHFNTKRADKPKHFEEKRRQKHDKSNHLKCELYS